MKHILVITFFLVAHLAHSQKIMSISGPTTVTLGETKTYTVVWTSGGMGTTPPSLIMTSWFAYRGNFTTYNSASASILWNSVGVGYLTLEYESWEGYFYETIYVTVTAGSPPVAPTATAATNLTNFSPGAFGFTANWTSVAGATGYRVDVSKNSNFTSFVSGFNDLPVSSPSRFVDGLTPHTTYYYWVRAENLNGTSGNSNFITVPGAPILLDVTNKTMDSFTINWNSVPGAISYQLDVSLSIDFSPSSFVSGFQNLAVSGTTKNINGLNHGTVYYYRVRAVSNSTTSLNSAGNTSTLIGNNENYVLTNQIMIPHQDENTISDLEIDLGKRNESYQYFDGLGRPMQSVMTMGSPNKHDIVQPIVYDEFGRESVNYLPYVSTGVNGWFKDDFVGKEDVGYTSSDQYIFYNNTSTPIAHDTKPYAETVFEPSPLNRVLKQGSPGQAWQPNGNATDLNDHTIKMRYELNQVNEVILFEYNETTEELDFSNGIGYYAANELFASKTYDEENHQIIEFKDKTGRVVLKRVEAPNSEWADTYYVYDDFGNLVVVLPPEGVKQLLTSVN